MTPLCLRSLVALLLVGSTAALPLAVPERTLCANGQCDKLDMKYERIVPVQPGIQWPDAGGYCGSWASQRAFLGIGAWVSQQQVRDHTVSCGHGAHDEEILSCNIEEAWTNLKIEFNSFDYMNQTKPQTAAYVEERTGNVYCVLHVVWYGILIQVVFFSFCTSPSSPSSSGTRRGSRSSW